MTCIRSYRRKCTHFAGVETIPYISGNDHRVSLEVEPDGAAVIYIYIQRYSISTHSPPYSQAHNSPPVFGNVALEEKMCSTIFTVSRTFEAMGIVDIFVRSSSILVVKSSV